MVVNMRENDCCRQEDDRFIVLASDGVWEFIESQVILYHLFSALRLIAIRCTSTAHYLTHLQSTTQYYTTNKSINLFITYTLLRLIQEAVHIVQKELQKGSNVEAACQVLIETAAERWAEEEGDYRDDVSTLQNQQYIYRYIYIHMFACICSSVF